MTERRLSGVVARIDERIPRPEDFRSELRGPRTAARVGAWLGIAFGVCFLTGLYSHVLQHPVGWLPLPTRPARLYQVTQGLHVASGTAAVPLLLVKLWSVVPRFFERPSAAPRRLVLDLLEKGSVALLVGAGVFQLATGLANSAQWYPWSFGFIQAHFAVAWVAVGSILVHVAVRLPVIRAAFRVPPEPTPPGPGVPSRRALLRTTWLSAGLAVLATTSVGIPGVRRLAVLAVRSGQGPRASRSTAARSAPRSPTSSTTRTGGSPSPGRPAPCRSRSTTSTRCRSARRSCRSPASRAGAPPARGEG